MFAGSFSKRTATALAAAVIVGTGSWLALGPLAQEAGATTTTVTIPSTTPYTDTGIALTQGESVTIAMSGTIHYLKHATSGPVGKSFSKGNCGLTQYQNPPGSPFQFQAYGLNCWGSLFKVGLSGIPFATGNSITFTSPVTGELFIGINDNFFLDNSGAYTANITTP